MEKITNTKETTEITTIYFNVKGEKTGDTDYEKRERSYQLKTARNYEDLKAKKDGEIVIHYIQNGVEKSLNDLIKLDASKVNVMDLAQLLTFQAKMTSQLELIKVRSAKINQYKEVQTGNIVMLSRIDIELDIA